MKKRLLACLLAVALFCSSIQLVTASEVDPEEVSNAIDQAQMSEASAGAAAIPSKNAGIIIDEAIASVNDQIAQNKLDDAVDVIDEANKALSDDAQAAKDAADAADAANTQAQKDKEQALENQIKAESDLEDAKKAEKSKDAQLSADDAKDNASQATDAAKDAYEQALVAQTKADEAKKAYDQAVTDYNKAVEEANALLAQGLINAQEAKERTAAAAEIANNYNEAMLQAQKDAEQASALAKENMDNANEALKEEIKKLDEIIAENAKEIAQKSAIAVATGAALGVSKIAVSIAQQTVNYYEGRIEDLEKKVSELEKAISDSEAVIAKAKKELEEFNEGEEAQRYAEAAEKLAAAEQAEAYAKEILDNAKDILELKEKAEYAEAMKNLQSKVADKTATTDDIKQLTEIVIDHCGDYSGPKLAVTNWETDSVFKVTDSEGNVAYYEAKVDNGVVQYYPTELVKEKVVESGDEMVMPPVSGRYTSSIGTVIVNNGKYQIQALGKYDLKWDEDGAYYKTIVGKIYVTITDTQFNQWVSEKDPVSTNSNTISDTWTGAENAKSNYDTAVKDLKKAKKEYDQAEKDYKAYADALNALINAHETKIENEEAKKEALKEQLKDLDEKLNGSLIEQLFRAVITGDKETLISAGEELAVLALKLLNPFLPAEERAAIMQQMEEMSGAIENGEKVLEIIKAISSGEFDLDNIGTIVELITDSGVSAKTRLAITQALEKVINDLHDKSVDNLRNAVEKAEQAVADQNKAIANATKEALSADAAYAQAKIKEAAADIVAADAKNLKDKADKAAKDANEAYELYKQLLEQGLAPDDAYVVEAREAYERAQASADQAMAAYNDAKASADLAAVAYANAQKIADDLAAKEAQEETTATQTEEETKATNNESNNTKIDATSVKTGDTSTVMVWMLLLALASFVVIVARKKKSVR